MRRCIILWFILYRVEKNCDVDKVMSDVCVGLWMWSVRGEVRKIQFNCIANTAKILLL